MRLLNLFLAFLFMSLIISSHELDAQMNVNGQILYGNEWIDYSKDYYKIKIGRDGIYRLDIKSLKAAGLDLEGIVHEDLQLWNFGQEVPIFTSASGPVKDSDYIEFYGKKHTLGLDTFLYADWRNEMANTRYSVINDTSGYFLTINKQANNKRFNVIKPDYNSNTVSTAKGMQFVSGMVYSSTLFKPEVQGEKVKYSNYVKAEGFTSGFAVDQNYTIDTKNKIDLGEPIRLTLRIINNGVTINRKQVYFNGTLLGTVDNGIHDIAELIYTIPYSELKDQNQIQIKNVGINDQHMVSYIGISYSHNTDLTGEGYVAFSNPDSKYIEFISPAMVERVYDIHDQVVYTTNTNLGQDKFGVLFNQSNIQNAVFDINTEQIKLVSKIRFQDLRGKNANYLMISSKKLYSSAGGGNDYLMAYKDYRSSAAGGGFNTELLFVEELYDQFGYGVDRHSYTFKNLSHYLKSEWPHLEYVFMLGKGREYRDTRTKEQLLNPLNFSFYIPTFGDSPSDNMLFSTGASSKPLFAIGRIAAVDMNEIGYFLEKVKVHEDAVNLPQDQEKLWLKRIMHLGGGDVTKPAETLTIKGHLTRMQEEIESNQFGGKVLSFYKNANIDIQIASLTEILEGINSGLAILTFFGHASVGNFDFDLDNAANYRNEGKLPFLFSLGCYSGNICSRSKGIGENFVLTPKVGAIGFVAAAGTAYLGTQGIFGEKFYKELGYKYYNESIGKILQGINAENEPNQASGTRTLFQQLTLHGDPAIRLNAFEKPDYTADPKSTKTEPSILSQSDSEFLFECDINNLGKNIMDSIEVSVVHLLPNGDTNSFNKIKISNPGYSKKIQVKLPIPKLNSLGKNSIQVFVESEQKIDETSEFNNILKNENGTNGFEFFITNGNLEIVYPKEFSIVNNDKALVLKASGSNLFQPQANYFFEMDTTEEFNSNLLIKHEVKNGGALVEWKPNLNLIDGKVYYWRLGYLEPNSNVLLWKNSSFIYLKDHALGWNQSHYFQWNRDNLNSLMFDRNGTTNFDNRERIIKFRSEIYRSEDVPLTTVDGSKWGALTPFSGTNDIIQVNVWTPLGLYLNPNGNSFNSIPWDANATFVFDPLSVEARQGIRDLLNTIPEESIVFVNFYLANENSDFKIDEWLNDSLVYGENFFSVLEKYGAKRVRELITKGTVPYIYHFQKASGYISEVIANNKLDQISLTGKVKPNFSTGTIQSTLVGPSSSWKDLIWQHANVEAHDSSYVSVYLKTSVGAAPIFYSKFLNTGQISLANIDAKTYPYIELVYKTVDGTKRTATTIKHWRVTYTPLPDLAFIKDENFLFKSNDIDEGDILKFAANLKNISEVDVKDSVEIKFVYTNGSNNQVVQTQKIGPLKSDEIVAIRTEISTLGWKKQNQFSVEVNEKNVPQEEYYFNNVGVNIFNVKSDSINPNLQVTFDGIKILNGDYVNAKPEIKLVLKDDNKFILLNKPELFKISLKKGITPNAPIEVIDVHSPLIQFIGASGNNNEAVIIYKPTLNDGQYTLIISALDETGNVSGKVDYTVTFKVESKKTISNVYNYPNPFSTSTRFVFNVTGQVPDQMKIQIMTVNGKVVKEILKNEMGSIRLGNNITEYSWNGTDDFGSKLANGVYLYRLVTNAIDYEASEVDVDNNLAFKQGFGKLVILR